MKHKEAAVVIAIVLSVCTCGCREIELIRPPAKLPSVFVPDVHRVRGLLTVLTEEMGPDAVRQALGLREWADQGVISEGNLVLIYGLSENHLLWLVFERGSGSEWRFREASIDQKDKRGTEIGSGVGAVK